MIEVRNLCKKFGDFEALSDLSFDVADGEIFALTGANGAGKSTFMKILSGIEAPASGSVSIDGRAVYENPEVKRDFFYISDDQYYLARSTPADFAFFYEHIYPRFDRSKALETVRFFGLPEKRRADTYSKGMKKLLSVAFALSSGTDYIFGDETFDGIDPLMKEAVRDLISKEQKQRKLTVLINSHNLRELEGFCTSAALIHAGRLIAMSPVGGEKTPEDIYLEGMRSLGIDAGKAVF